MPRNRFAFSKPGFLHIQRKIYVNRKPIARCKTIFSTKKIYLKNSSNVSNKMRGPLRLLRMSPSSSGRNQLKTITRFAFLCNQLSSRHIAYGLHMLQESKKALRDSRTYYHQAKVTLCIPRKEPHESSKKCLFITRLGAWNEIKQKVKNNKISERKMKRGKTTRQWEEVKRPHKAPLPFLQAVLV